MLIPNQIVKVKIGSGNVNHYKELGYKIPTRVNKYGKIVSDFGKYINVRQIDLTKGSSELVDVKCDICGKIMKRPYAQYNVYHNLGYDCCKKCNRKKSKDTHLERYGVEYYSQTQEHKEKIINTSIERYGYESFNQCPEIKEKQRNATKIKYGVEIYMKSLDFKIKANNTMTKYGTCKTSKQQIELHKMIQEKYPDAILNYPYDRCIFDIAIILNDKNIKIDIEYDCWYWHKNQEKDMRRDYYSLRRGWKILRVKSGMKLPDKEELFDAIEYLINTEHHHKNIILDDWKSDDNRIETA